MLTSHKLLLLVICVVAVQTGCATKTPYLDDHFGEAVNAAKAQQIINPDASLAPVSITGVDGEAANAAVDRYHKSFVQPPASTNVFNIGVGSGSGSSTTTGSGSGAR